MLHWRKNQKLYTTKRRSTLTVEVLVMGFIAVATILVIITKINISSFYSPISAFTMGEKTIELKANVFKTKTKITQGEDTYLQMQYDPGKIQIINIKVLDINGETVLNTKSYKAEKSGDSAILIDTNELKLGEYVTEIADQNNKRVFRSNLTIH